MKLLRSFLCEKRRFLPFTGLYEKQFGVTKSELKILTRT